MHMLIITPVPTNLYIHKLYISEGKQKTFFSSNVNIEAEGTYYKYTWKWNSKSITQGWK